MLDGRQAPLVELLDEFLVRTLVALPSVVVPKSRPARKDVALRPRLELHRYVGEGYLEAPVPGPIAELCLESDPGLPWSREAQIKATKFVEDVAAHEIGPDVDVLDEDQRPSSFGVYEWYGAGSWRQPRSVVFHSEPLIESAPPTENRQLWVSTEESQRIREPAPVFRRLGGILHQADDLASRVGDRSAVASNLVDVVGVQEEVVRSDKATHPLLMGSVD